MLEYFAYKKYKKHKAEKDEKKEDKGKAKEEIIHSPVLEPDDESFLESLASDEGPAPPLPPRIKTPEITWDSDDFSRRSGEISDSSVGSAAVAEEGDKDKGKEKDKDKKKRFSVIPFFGQQKKKQGATLAPPADASKAEVDREERDISRILRSLHLTTDSSDRVVSLTPDVANLAKRFTQVLKDLANGVPTAYSDLVSLVEDRDGLLDRSFEKLPSSLQKLVMQMPDKITASLAPDVLKAAAAAQGKEVIVEGGGLKDAAMSLLTVKGLQEMVTKPGAIAGMLRSIVNALKLRFPAFIGTNLLWSVAVFLLLFVLWYCYKRGREERLKKEATEGAKKEGNEDRLSIEEVHEGEGESSRAGGSASHTLNPVPVVTEPDDEPATAPSGGPSRIGN